MIDAENGHDTIPTALFFAEGGNRVYYGRDAKRMYTDNEIGGRFMRSMKRILGTAAMNGGTIINGHPTTFSNVIETFVRYIKTRIDTAAGASVESVVMGRPVHFRDNDTDGDARAQAELEHIARAVGFKNVSFQYEPIAAAFAHEARLQSEKLAVVVDVGGGTSDFTIIRLSPMRAKSLDRTADVLANTGVRIGGNDFDKNFAIQSFMPLFGMGSEYKSGDKLIGVPVAPYFSLATWSAVNEVYNYKTLNMVRGLVISATERERVARLYEIIENRLGHRNLDCVENTKITLSTNATANVCLDFLGDAPSVDVTRKMFEDAIENDIAKIERSVRECVTAAGIKNTDIELIILTGGSTEIPRIISAMLQLFPNAAISSDNRMASVGLGLAYDAMRRYHTN